MNLYQLNQFCARHSLVFVEKGNHEGCQGLWFKDYQQKRVFLSLEEVNEMQHSERLKPIAR